MRFTIEKPTLLSAIQHLLSIVPTKNITPILTCFLLEADADTGNLKITATDLEITVIVNVAASVSESGKVALNARNLTDVINSLDDKPINFQLEEGFVRIRCSNSKFSLHSAEHMTFPQVPDMPTDTSSLKFSAEIFSRMVNIASIAVLTETSRPIFTGILWRIYPDKQMMVTSDGKKIVEITKDEPFDIQENIEHVIPTKGLYFLEKVINDKEPDVMVNFEANRITFTYANYVVISQIIPGKFPDYEKIFDVDNPNELLIDKNVLRQAIRRVSILSSEEFFRVKFDVSPESIILSSVNSEMGDAFETITDHQYSGDPFAIAFNFKYLLSILNVVESEKVKITFGVPEGGLINNQVIFYNEPEAENYRPIFLLMPLRLR
ncbi:MAG: DNA polymerase III subunit beta [Candidatus Cloacimonas sp.]|nr:DNA polymerase III subunit beta [Candidatus Cloacimonadota bacterium]